MGLFESSSLVRLVIAVSLAITTLFSAEFSARFVLSSLISGTAPSKSHRHANNVSYPTSFAEMETKSVNEVESICILQFSSRS